MRKPHLVALAILGGAAIIVGLNTFSGDSSASSEKTWREELQEGANAKLKIKRTHKHRAQQKSVDANRTADKDSDLTNVPVREQLIHTLGPLDAEGKRLVQRHIDTQRVDRNWRINQLGDDASYLDLSDLYFDLTVLAAITDLLRKDQYYTQLVSSPPPPLERGYHRTTFVSNAKIDGKRVQVTFDIDLERYQNVKQAQLDRRQAVVVATDDWVQKFNQLDHPKRKKAFEAWQAAQAALKDSKVFSKLSGEERNITMQLLGDWRLARWHHTFRQNSLTFYRKQRKRR